MYVDVGLATVALLAGVLATSSATGASPPRSLITGRPLVNAVGSLSGVSRCSDLSFVCLREFVLITVNITKLHRPTLAVDPFWLTQPSVSRCVWSTGPTIWNELSQDCRSTDTM